MRPTPVTITTWLLLSVMWLITTAPEAVAERLPMSDLGSTLEPQCEFCWYPSPPEAYSNRLPTYRQHRPRRPPGSRPQHYPKGRYKLEPAHKQTKPISLHTRSPHAFPLLSTLNLRVLDGDTFRVGGERIRLRGIDTPELAELEGPAAKQRLEQLLHSGPIHIVPYGRDVYRRLLVDVFVNGQYVVEILRGEGFSKADESTIRGIVQLIRSQTEPPHARSIVMKPLSHNNNRSEVEVTTISKHGIWLLSTTKELFIPFNEYPRFRNASVANIFHIEQPTPNRLHWPHLGMTVSLESLRCFPIISKPSHPTARSGRQAKT